MIYAIDVGSTIPSRNGKEVAFAWSGVDQNGREVATGTCPEELVNEIGRSILAGQSVAIGVEAPLFIPVPSDKSRLSKGRLNEADRSWAAPAGGYVTALAAHQCAWLLRELFQKCGRYCELTADPDRWYRRSSPPVIFCWEAFVSGGAHGNHQEDARTAAMYFFEHQSDLKTAVTAENPFSLFGAAVLWSGWSTDQEWLKREMVVLRPARKWVAPA